MADLQEKVNRVREGFPGMPSRWTDWNMGCVNVDIGSGMGMKGGVEVTHGHLDDVLSATEAQLLLDQVPPSQ